MISMKLFASRYLVGSCASTFLNFSITIILHSIFHPLYSGEMNLPLNFWDLHVGPKNPMVNLQKEWLCE
jgi:hypothetical protein